MANQGQRKRKGVSDGELASRLAKHLMAGGESKDDAVLHATVYYNSHHCRKSKEELEKEAKAKELKNFLHQMEEAKAKANEAHIHDFQGGEFCVKCGEVAEKEPVTA
jgi:hypothetical protein